MKVIRSIWRWTIRFLLFLMLLFVVVWAVLQFPKVQTFVVQKVTHQLSQSLHTEASVGGVNIKFFKRVALEDILIKDRQQDTLLFAGALESNISIFSFFQKKIHLKDVKLSDALVHLSRQANTHEFNFDFIFNALSGSDSNDNSGGGWNFGIGGVQLQKVKFRYYDEVVGEEWNSSLEDFGSAFEKLDFKNRILSFDDIYLSQSSIAGELWQSRPLVEMDTLKDAISSKSELPYVGWDFKVNRLYFEDNSFVYRDLRNAKKTNGLDLTDLFLEKINFKVEDFLWKKNQMKGQVEEVFFKEKSGFQVDQLAGKVLLDSTRISVQELIFKTPNTKINNNFALNFSEWNDLKSEHEQLNITTQFLKTTIAFSDLKLLEPLIGSIPFLNISSLENLFLNGKMEGRLNDFSAKNLDLKIGNKLMFSGDAQIKNVTKVEDLQFDINIQNLSTSYDKVQNLTKNISLPKGLRNFGKLNLTAKAKGKLDNFFISKLELTSTANSKIKATGSVKNVTSLDGLVLDLDLKQLQTRTEDIAGFSLNQLPPQLDSLGLMEYSGKYRGNFKKYDLDGIFQTDLGDLESNILLHFNDDYSSATYSGDIITNSFHLGKLLGNVPELETVAVRTHIRGEGFELDSLNAVVKGEIQQLYYKKYPYSNIEINGNFEKRKFIGTLKSNDANAKLDFSGKINLNDAQPDYEFALNVDTLNLKNLNLSKENFSGQGQIVIDVQGNSPENLDGNIEIFNLNLSQDSLHFHTDSIFLIAHQKEAKNKKISVRSDFIYANLSGDYYLEQFPELAKSFVEEFISLEALQLEDKDINSDSEQLDNQSFRIELMLTDPTPFTILFVPELTQLDSVHLVGKINSRTKKIALDGNIKKVSYAGISAEDIYLDTKGNPQAIDQKIELNNLKMDSRMEFPFAEINSRLVRDSLHLGVRMEGNDGQQKLITSGVMTYFKDLLLFHFKEKFVLNDSLWTIKSGHSVFYKKDFFEINDFKIEKNGQSLLVNSLEEKIKQTSIAPVEILFEKFRLEEIFELINDKASYLSGELNGNVLVKDLLTNPHYNVNLNVPMLKIDGQEAGRLVALATQPENQSKISMMVNLSGENDALNAQGDYDIQSRQFNVKSTVQKMEMSLLDPYLQGFVSESKGSLSGAFDLKGTPEAPILKGFFMVLNVSTLIDFTKSRYQISEQKIIFDENQFDFGVLKLKDEENHLATLSGKVYHDFFTNFRLALALDTEEFQFLNTTITDNSLFYGKLFLRANLKINGSIKSPLVEIVARTLPKSEFTLSPFSETDFITNESYIIFGNPESLRQQDTTQNIYMVQNAFPFDVNLNLELTDAASFQFIVDPLSGDKLSCRGKSNLIINMKPSGEMQMFGIYTISSGTYNFSYGDFIKREFKIQQGGTVAFNGDPLNARFDVTAVRTTRSSTYELIANETTLDDAEIQEAQKRQLVNVLLKLNGDLSTPQITFDIQLPENEGTTITSTIERKLDALRNDPNELNKQVFGLLLVNSFIISSAVSAELVSAGESAVLSSVSKLFSNQLNQLADRYIKGVEVSVDVNSYKSQYAGGSTVTEVGVGVSKQLFKERLNIKATGNVDVNSANNASTFSTLAGDFLLEYKLTEKGNYILKVFRKSNYDVLNESDATKNGVSISFKRSFDRKKKNK